MKKWLIALCCFLIAGAAAFIIFMNNSNERIDTLNKDLGDLQAEYNNLKGESEEYRNTIGDLNLQVENLTAEKDKLTAENKELNDTLDGLNRNLSSSQQKLQGVMYILTDGEKGSIDDILSPYIKIFQDVPLNNPYYEAVSFVNDRRLMTPLGEEIFGAAESATLGEFAESLFLLQGKTGTRAEAAAALLRAETAWLASQSTAAAEEPEAEPVKEGSEPASAEAEASAEEAGAPAEEAAAGSAEEATEASAEEEAGAPAEEAAAASAEEEAEAPAEETAEAPAEETAGGSADEEAAAPAPEEPAEDETLVLTRERLLSLCSAFSYETGKDLPEITFPESASEDASRGDLAVALFALSR